MVSLRHVGTIDPYLHAALSPDGATLYVNHDGSDIRTYSFPGLAPGSVVRTPGNPTWTIEGVACGDDGTLYWWENTHGFGLDLFKDLGTPTSFYSTSDEQFPVGLCWYDGLLYGFGITDVTDGYTLTSWDPSVAGGDRTVLWTPLSENDDLKFVNNPVPTLDGAIWWSYPDTNNSFAMIVRYDIAGGTADDNGGMLVDDMFIPRPNGRPIAWGTPAFGGIGEDWYFFYAEDASNDWPVGLADFSPGVRAVAYTPNQSTVCFERGATGEVWTFGGGWTVGRVAWGSRGTWH